MARTPQSAAASPVRRSPLRVATMTPAAIARPAAVPPGPAATPRELVWPELRKMMADEFAEWLRTQTNKHKLPFQEQTIHDYRETALTLDRWMTEKKIEADFTACDENLLN